MTQNLDVVILCGGQGTRLREETEFKPKPLVEIGGHPILWHIMKHYRVHGLRDFILCLGYKGDLIKDFFLNYNAHRSDFTVDLASGAVTSLAHEAGLDWRVTLADTGVDALTARRLVLAAKYLRGDTFFATYGDGISNVDLDALYDHHKRSGKLATVTAVHPSSRFGELQLDGNVVSTFKEKPQTNEGWINGGFFVFERRALDRVPADTNVALESGLLEQLAQDGQLSVYRHEGFWQCMDTYREMLLLNEMWQEGNAPWKTW